MKKVGAAALDHTESASNSYVYDSRSLRGIDYTVSQLKDMIYEITVAVEENLSASDSYKRSHSPISGPDHHLPIG
jgi:hypothetical protein